MGTFFYINIIHPNEQTIKFKKTKNNITSFQIVLLDSSGMTVNNHVGIQVLVLIVKWNAVVQKNIATMRVDVISP